MAMGKDSLSLVACAVLSLAACGDDSTDGAQQTDAGETDSAVQDVGGEDSTIDTESVEDASTMTFAVSVVVDDLLDPDDTVVDTPIEGVSVVIEALGGETVTLVTDPDGLATYDGPDLAGEYVAITAFAEGFDAYTIIVEFDGEPAGPLRLQPVHDDSEWVRVSGDLQGIDAEAKRVFIRCELGNIFHSLFSTASWHADVPVGQPLTLFGIAYTITWPEPGEMIQRVQNAVTHEMPGVDGPTTFDFDFSTGTALPVETFPIEIVPPAWVADTPRPEMHPSAVVRTRTWESAGRLGLGFASDVVWTDDGDEIHVDLLEYTLEGQHTYYEVDLHLEDPTRMTRLVVDERPGRVEDGFVPLADVVLPSGGQVDWDDLVPLEDHGAWRSGIVLSSSSSPYRWTIELRGEADEVFFPTVPEAAADVLGGPFQGDVFVCAGGDTTRRSCLSHSLQVARLGVSQD